MRNGLGALLLGLTAAAAGPLHAQSELDRTPSRFAIYDGARIHFKSFGTGRTAVVFVPGWISDLTVWRYQVEALSARTRLVVLDLPGQGRSGQPSGPYTMDRLAGAIKAVVDAAGVDRAVLVGHSLGVPVIRQFYRRYPDRVAAMVVVDGALEAPALDSASVARAVAPFEGGGYRASVERMVGSMYPDDLQAGLRRMILGPALATPPAVAVAAMRAMYDPAIWRNDPIAVPLLVVVAKKTGWPPSTRALVQRLAPGARYEEMDGVSHYLMLESPDAFNPILTTFLDSLGVLRS
jgi:sigma-B regulation protein RsbQ